MTSLFKANVTSIQFQKVITLFSNEYEYQLRMNDNLRPLLTKCSTPKKAPINHERPLKRQVEFTIKNQSLPTQRLIKLNHEQRFNDSLDELTYRIAISLLTKIHAHTGDTDIYRIKLETWEYMKEIDTLTDIVRYGSDWQENRKPELLAELKKSIVSSGGSNADGKELLSFIKCSILENALKCFKKYGFIDLTLTENRQELTKVHTSYKTCKQTIKSTSQAYLSWIYSETRRFIDGQKKRLENDEITISVESLTVNENGDTMDIRIPHSQLWMKETRGVVSADMAEYQKLKKAFENIKLTDSMILFLYLYTDEKNYSFSQIGEIYAVEKGYKKPYSKGAVQQLKERTKKRFEKVGLDFGNIERLRKQNFKKAMNQKEFNQSIENR